MNDSRSLGASYWGVFAIVAVGTYAVHEGAHWLTGKALGYPVSYGINSVIPGTPMTVTDHTLMSAAGPAVTVALALFAFALVMRRGSMVAYGALFFALFMRAVAAGVSLFNPNDEARVSETLGLGPWVLPVAVIALLLVPTVVASRHLKLSLKTNALAYAVSSLVAAAVVWIDMVHRGTI